MPRWRPLATASTATAIAAALAFGLSGGHSPFAPAPAAAGPAADAVAAATASPAMAAAVPADEAADPASPTPATDAPSPSAGPPSTTATARPAGGARATPRPTSRPTPPPGGAPTARPTAAPTPTPTPAPPATPVATPALTVRDGDSGPVLSWSSCSASSFAAYAVVRSTDSEIHFPAEDRDTVVAIVTSSAATRLTDTAAPAATRVWYAVWCLSQEGGEYKTIWKTPTVAYTP